jgi:hypothetical protein
MSSDGATANATEKFTMSVTTKGNVNDSDSSDMARFYAVIPGLSSDNITFSGDNIPAVVTDDTERGYAGASEGDLALAWGPEGGFSLSAHELAYESEDGLSTEFTATISEPGTYTVSFVFYDLTKAKQINGADETVTVTISE